MVEDRKRCGQGERKKKRSHSEREVAPVLQMGYASRDSGPKLVAPGSISPPQLPPPAAEIPLSWLYCRKFFTKPEEPRIIKREDRSRWKFQSPKRLILKEFEGNKVTVSKYYVPETWKGVR